ncbi:phytanoyl-CoA dioxygenase family protein [Nonomuraea sp. NPDC050786]|uniref:phytanoyl-CoA dioxygenase family protein n=1 Tax=Nonomuraea sp. NPDC050786 TaxID=3154840 RepID=UPI003410F0FB
MQMQEALDELGASPSLLDTETIEDLDRIGFATIPGIMPRELLEQFRESLARLEAREGQDGGKEVGQELGAYRLSDLVNKDSIFDICFTHPKLLAAVAHVLRDFKISSCSSRAVLPGQGHQTLHADWWGTEPEFGDYQVCNSIWLLDDFTSHNGSTRFVPGTHISRGSSACIAIEHEKSHPKEVLLTAPAGTVVVFNGHIWHGGTKNQTNSRRRSLNAYFTRRHNSQQLNQAAFVRPETLARLGHAARFILDV